MKGLGYKKGLFFQLCPVLFPVSLSTIIMSQKSLESCGQVNTCRIDSRELTCLSSCVRSNHPLAKRVEAQCLSESSFSKGNAVFFFTVCHVIFPWDSGNTVRSVAK